MASPSIRPHMLVADEQGNIYDHPDFLLLCRRGEEWSLPRPDELMPLPEESELFLLPGRRAVGLNPETGETEVMEDWAVAAFAAPAHTLTAHPVYMTDEGAPMLPLFAYGAVGFANGRFYVCAKKVDEDVRQVFKGISRGKIDRSARKIIEDFPDNRLMQHIMQNCTLRYGCPAAKNLSLGRYEAPLLIESVRRYREAGGHGTINLNSNSSRPQAIAELAEAGLTSLRVSLNSARPEVYERYYRPHGYTFGDVRQSIIEARSRGVHVAVNLLYFPGITDTEEEIEALIELFQSTGISLVQLRNLNIDPEFYPSLLEGISFGPSVGLNNFRKRIRRACPWITYGYFNPYLGDKADLGDTPMPGEWKPAPLEVSEAEEESGN